MNEAMKHHGEIFPIAILTKTMLRNLHVMMLTNLLRWNVRNAFHGIFDKKKMRITLNLFCNCSSNHVMLPIKNQNLVVVWVFIFTDIHYLWTLRRLSYQGQIYSIK